MRCTAAVRSLTRLTDAASANACKEARPRQAKVRGRGAQTLEAMAC